MATYNAAPTSVPLMNMGSYQTFTKSEGITSRFARVAIPIYDRVVGFRDLLALALAYAPVRTTSTALTLTLVTNTKGTTFFTLVWPCAMRPRARRPTSAPSPRGS